MRDRNRNRDRSEISCLRIVAAKLDQAMGVVKVVLGLEVAEAELPDPFGLTELNQLGLEGLTTASNMTTDGY